MEIEKALDWLTDVLAVQGRRLELEDTRESVAEWDSLGTLLLLSRFEEDFGIVINVDEIAAINSVRELCGLLEKNNAFHSR